MVSIDDKAHKKKRPWYTTIPTSRSTRMLVALPTTAAIAVSCCILGAWLHQPLNQQQPRNASIQPECEGYWPSTEICLPLGKNPSKSLLTAENAGCPQWRINALWEKKSIATKLKEMESLAKEWDAILQEITPAQLERCGGEQGVRPPVWIVRQRGLAWSRIEEGVIAGNSEYRTATGEGWTDALLPIYIDEFSVEPSKAFQEFVVSYDVDGFRNELADFKNRIGPP